MFDFVWGIWLAFGLGIFTSISPCPLATNIAAISYIGRKLGDSRHVFLTGLLYAIGRTVAYVALASVLVAGLLSVPKVSFYLQEYMHLAAGPLLILVGMILLGLIEIQFGSGGIGAGLQKRVDALGVWGALLLGIVFALTFCPTSAALFFLQLIPLSIDVNSTIALPAVYGVGTAVPVVVFAVLLATSAQLVGKAYNVLAKVEWFARMATGSIFIAVGIYFSLVHVFEVL